MKAEVWIDGQAVQTEQAHVSIFDRAFPHGDSIFEVLRTYNGVPFALDEHLERLDRSARMTRIEMPVSLDVLRTEIGVALRTAAHRESYVRIMVTRGIGDRHIPDQPSGPRRVLFVAPLTPLSRETYTLGVNAVTHRAQLISSAVAQGAKLGNYLDSLLALEEARRANAAEALLLDGTGRIVEGSTSNVFMFSNGALVTPPGSAGILLGITREKVLGLAADWAVPVDLRTFAPGELYQADEAFITSSIREVVPVVRVDGNVVGTGHPGRLTSRLLAGYRALALREPNDHRG